MQRLLNGEPDVHAYTREVIAEATELPHDELLDKFAAIVEKMSETRKTLTGHTGPIPWDHPFIEISARKNAYWAVVWHRMRRSPQSRWNPFEPSTDRTGTIPT